MCCDDCHCCGFRVWWAGMCLQRGCCSLCWLAQSWSNDRDMHSTLAWLALCQLQCVGTAQGAAGSIVLPLPRCFADRSRPTAVASLAWSWSCMVQALPAWALCAVSCLISCCGCCWPGFLRWKVLERSRLSSKLFGLLHCLFLSARFERQLLQPVLAAAAFSVSCGLPVAMHSWCAVPCWHMRLHLPPVFVLLCAACCRAPHTSGEVAVARSVCWHALLVAPMASSLELKLAWSPCQQQWHVCCCCCICITLRLAQHGLRAPWPYPTPPQSPVGGPVGSWRSALPNSGPVPHAVTCNFWQALYGQPGPVGVVPAARCCC